MDVLTLIMIIQLNVVCMLHVVRIWHGVYTRANMYPHSVIENVLISRISEKGALGNKNKENVFFFATALVRRQ